MVAAVAETAGEKMITESVTDFQQLGAGVESFWTVSHSVDSIALASLRVGGVKRFLDPTRPILLPP